MPKNLFDRAFMRLYNLGWSLILPALRLNKRLQEGFEQRLFRKNLPGTADLWLQAASVGESFLAWELIEHLKLSPPVRVLVTTNTSQGFEILQRAIQEVGSHNTYRSISTAYFPFDQPRIMENAVKHISPKVMVLLEAELWPAHLSALKRYHRKIIVVNGRMTAKSLKRYRWRSSLWYQLRPDKILAISKADAKRFGNLFGTERVSLMPNIKFDRLKPAPGSTKGPNPLKPIIAPELKLLVFGSVRQQEEKYIEKIIIQILGRHPKLIIGLFPRHAHRVKYWKQVLSKHNLTWQMRSDTVTSVKAGTVILWDTYGELASAYKLSAAAFVGGTLAPLGGQNFLEPLISGIPTVIGPWWENFAWVGGDILTQDLIKIAADWKQTVEILDATLNDPGPHEKLRRAAQRYIGDRQGGTAIACQAIKDLFHSSD